MVSDAVDHLFLCFLIISYPFCQMHVFFFACWFQGLFVCSEHLTNVCVANILFPFWRIMFPLNSEIFDELKFTFYSWVHNIFWIRVQSSFLNNLNIQLVQLYLFIRTSFLHWKDWCFTFLSGDQKYVSFYPLSIPSNLFVYPCPILDCLISCILIIDIFQLYFTPSRLYLSFYNHCCFV